VGCRGFFRAGSGGQSNHRGGNALSRPANPRAYHGRTGITGFPPRRQGVGEMGPWPIHHPPGWRWLANLWLSLREHAPSAEMIPARNTSPEVVAGSCNQPGLPADHPSKTARPSIRSRQRRSQIRHAVALPRPPSPSQYGAGGMDCPGPTLTSPPGGGKNLLASSVILRLGPPTSARRFGAR